jgi:hypothetical protein
MVLLRDRRAEQRENAVAGGLHHATVVALDGVGHQLERRVDDRTCFFRVEILLKFGGALDICEQRRDRLAFAGETFRSGSLGYPNRRIT